MLKQTTPLHKQKKQEKDPTGFYSKDIRIGDHLSERWSLYAIL